MINLDYLYSNLNKYQLPEPPPSNEDISDEELFSHNYFNRNIRNNIECIKYQCTDVKKKQFGEMESENTHSSNKKIIARIIESIFLCSLGKSFRAKKDIEMIKLNEEYPEYGFAKHKGYGTAEHVEALKKYGPCPIHRMSFIKGILGQN